jgi:hypothetical protein
MVKVLLFPSLPPTSTRDKGSMGYADPTTLLGERVSLVVSSLALRKRYLGREGSSGGSTPLSNAEEFFGTGVIRFGDLEVYRVVLV